MTGMIKFTAHDKGYGFICEDGGAGRDHFFHCSKVAPSTRFEALESGDRVSFDVGVDERSGRLRAVNVELI